MNLLDMSQFTTLQELREYTEKLFKTNLMLQNDIKHKDEKIGHLESLLNTLPANSQLLADDKEIEICNIEINRLYQKSLRMPLEDKEVRNLEVYVKTKAVAKGKSISEVKDKKDKEAVKNMPTAKLIELAKSIKSE